MAWSIISKEEVAASKNGANALLSCFTDLRGEKTNKIDNRLLGKSCIVIFWMKSK